MKTTRICKVCGAEYEYCHSARRADGVFRWQDVACSPEHGSAYFAEILASRGEVSRDERAVTDNSRRTKKKNTASCVVLDGMEGQ